MGSIVSIEEARGTMPILQYCAPGQLQVDATYQRDIDDRGQTLVRAIAQRWEWSLCQPLVIARRADGGLFIIDGQHRWAAAKVRGDIPLLPCVVIDSTGADGEAGQFVKLNRQRNALTPFALFRAAVAAGEEAAVAVDRIVREAGLSITGQRNAALLKPGQVSNIGALRSYHRVHGDKGLRLAAKVLAESYYNQVLPAHPTLFVAIGGVLAAEGGGAAGLLTILIAERPQEEWLAAFAAHAAAHGGTRFGAAVPALLAAYREAAAD